ncbi:MAG: hypothetical protein AB8I08_25680 [Sandaracinaceae bacterium]
MRRYGMRREWALVMGCLFAVACGEAMGVDAGVLDSSAPDAGSTDAGSTDAGTTDAGTTDAGLLDAGLLDAGLTDAGLTDAGLTDAGLTDAGPTDAGPFMCGALSADGTVLVADPDASSAVRSIVWNGRHYAVVWLELRSTSPTLFKMMFALVTDDGAVVPGSRHEVFPSDPGSHGSASLAVGDGIYGLTYRRADETGLTATSRARFVRLDADGFPLDLGVQISDPDVGYAGDTSVAWSSETRQWAAAWMSTEALGAGFINRHVRVTRLSEGGTILDVSGELDALTTGSFRDERAIVWTGDRFAVGMTEFVSVTNNRVSVVELDDALAVARRIIVENRGRPSGPGLVVAGSSYGVMWENLVTGGPNRTRFRAAAIGGDPLGAVVEVGPDTGSSQGAIVGGAHFRVVSHQMAAGSQVAVMQTFGVDGGALGGPRRLFEAGSFSFSRVASDGCNDAVLHTDSLVAPSDIRVHLAAGTAAP